MYVNVYVPKSGGSVVPKSDVYKYSDPRGDGLGGGESTPKRFLMKIAKIAPPSTR